MNAPRVQIYVQPTPYTVCEMLNGSYVSITNRDGRALCNYRAGTPATFGVARDEWPIHIHVNLPGFDPFACTLEQHGATTLVSTGGDDGTARFPGRIPR
jgi:hypothetical protein